MISCGLRTPSIREFDCIASMGTAGSQTVVFLCSEAPDYFPGASFEFFGLGDLGTAGYKDRRTDEGCVHQNAKLISHSYVIRTSTTVLDEVYPACSNNSC